VPISLRLLIEIVALFAFFGVIILVFGETWEGYLAVVVLIAAYAFMAWRRGDVGRLAEHTLISRTQIRAATRF
jgi:hypothetical protein